MNILVACEESQRITCEFLKLGHNAYSCDIKMTSGAYPGNHIYTDVRNIIKEKDITFYTQNNKYHFIKNWDLLIAHPPCTYLSKAAGNILYKNKVLNLERYKKGLKAKEFFMFLYNAPIEHICIENPVPFKIFELPDYTQIIQPYYFGDPYSKTTCLWLINLPKIPIDKSKIINDHSSWVYDKECNSNRQTKRSKTFPGIAKAIAGTWNKL